MTKKLPNLDRVKTISCLKNVVAEQLLKRGLPADKNWDIASTLTSENDLMFSDWLKEAIGTYEILKRRASLTLRT